MLRTTGLGLVGVTLADWLALNEVQAASAPAKPAPPLEPLNRFPRMVQEYFVQRVRDVEERGLVAKFSLKNRSDAEAYVRSVREKIQRSFGPWPKKTPLNPRVTRTVERDAYKIENVIFESRPNFLVTANLYIPKGRKFPLPGVVGSCGHSANGKAAEAYQSFAQGLARMGYVVLIFDPIGQGERLQYLDENLKARVAGGTTEHLHEGNQQFLVGEFFGSWRAWDGIRALDYLLTRPEVDPKQVGVTGNSGGGTMTTWLCGVEQRWTMAAPSCFVTTFLHNMENELPADTEQCPPRALALGLDHDDFLAALAPKPVIILAKERDFFDVRGSEEAFARLRHLYRLLGAEQNIGFFAGPTTHGYTQENREAMYRWFNHVTKISDAQAEPALTIEKDETLYCTPHGHVAELKSRPLFTFTRDISKELAAKRGKPGAKALMSAVRELLKIETTGDAPDYRILRTLRGRNHPAKQFSTYAVQTEPGIFAIVYRLGDEALVARPPRGASRAVLYVSHQSSDAELREEPLVRELMKAEPEAVFYTCDVRGIGESRPDTCGTNTFLNPYGSDYFYAVHSVMLDHPYAGQKTHDVLRVLTWLKASGHTDIHLAAKGWGAIPATFAALLSGDVKQVTLKNALTSYSDVAEAELYKWPLSSLVPGVLHKFDLPDCYRALEGKKLRMIEPWGPMAG
ncbi:MAG: prolyl oligopeptidase family serine peptidase [Verrucomicrobiota bacterium]